MGRKTTLNLITVRPAQFAKDLQAQRVLAYYNSRKGMVEVEDCEEVQKQIRLWRKRYGNRSVIY